MDSTQSSASGVTVAEVHPGADGWDSPHAVDAQADTWFLARLNHLGAGRFALVAYAVLGALPAIVFLLLNWRSGTLFIDGPALGYLEDVIFAFFFLAIPGMVALTREALQSLPRTLTSLVSVIRKPGDCPRGEARATLSPAGFDAILKKHEQFLNGVPRRYRVTKVIFHLIGLAYVAFAARAHYFAVETYTYDIWSSQNHLVNLGLRTCYEVVLFGIVIPRLAYKFVLVQRTIRGVFRELTQRNVIRLRPLSPDNAGGLGHVGQYALRLVYVLLPALVPLALYTLVLRVTPIIMVGFSVYIPLLVLVFFYPLSGARRAMKSFKEAELDFLAREFDRAYDHFMAVFGRQDDQDYEGQDLEEATRSTELLARLEALYDKAEAMPAWPFDTGTISRFGATIAVPFLVFLIEQLTSTDSIVFHLDKVREML